MPARTVPSGNIHWIILPLLAISLHAATPSITVEVSTETIPPQGTAQFKITLTSPALISSADIAMSFDPSVFGNISSVAAFSATGDQTGYAILNGTKFTAHFTSASSSIGQLPALPVFVVNVPVSNIIPAGATSTITVDPSAAPWRDQQGNIYSVTVNPATFTVGGLIDVRSVTPVGGVLPAGTVVAIYGDRFGPSATVTIDGVSLASVRPNLALINVTLGGAAELTGKHIQVTDQGETVDYFAAPYAATAFNNESLVLILPSPPSAPQTSAQWPFPDNYNFTYYSILQNPSQQPVNVNYYYADANNRVTKTFLVVPGNGLTVVDNGTLANTLGTLYMTASAPLRMTEAFVEFGGVAAAAINISRALPIDSLGPFGVGLEDLSGPPWIWQLGTPAPPPKTATIVSGYPFTVSLSGGAQEWLQVTPMSGGPGTTMLTLTPLVSNLGAGTYTGTVTLTENLPPDLAPFGSNTSSFNVTISVSPQPTITGASSAGFTINPGDASPATQTISLFTNGGAAAFTDTVTCSSGGNWLSVTPSSGTTPGPLTLTANSTGLSAGTYICDVLVQGPINTLTIPVQLNILSGLVDVTPSSLTFTLAPGQGPPAQPQIVKIEEPGAQFTFTGATQSGGKWLTAAQDGLLGIDVNASAIGLNAGTYQGEVDIQVTAPLVRHATVPVTLIVMFPTPPAIQQLAISPPSLVLTGAAGSFAIGNLYVSVVSGPGIFTVSNLTIGRVNPPSLTYTAPGTIQVEATSSLPGVYTGSITFSWTGGSTTIPITYYALASPSTPPIMSEVVSSGSEITGSLAPGELISIFGSALEGGTQVLINGITAPLIYASPFQVNAIVPFEAATTGTASVQVVAAGIQSETWAMPLSPSAPSIFTLSAAGVGPGAVVNQDGSINSPSNPAARGTYIQIYATGGGETSPPSSTGKIAQTATALTQTVTVTIGGATAQVLYAGSAPGELEGVVQINAVIPPSASPGPSQPVLITIGAAQSQSTVTIAIQ